MIIEELAMGKKAVLITLLIFTFIFSACADRKNLSPMPTIGEEAKKELLPKVREKAGHLGLKFLWYTPTQYCRLDPIKLGLGVKSCTAALMNMCVGPNGDVYPCQSYFEKLGNILEDNWRKIWNNTTAKRIRKREYVDPKCNDCPQLQICGGGCPLELQKDEFLCSESK